MLRVRTYVHTSYDIIYMLQDDCEIWIAKKDIIYYSYIHNNTRTYVRTYGVRYTLHYAFCFIYSNFCQNETGKYKSIPYTITITKNKKSKPWTIKTISLRKKASQEPTKKKLISLSLPATSPYCRFRRKCPYSYWSLGAAEWHTSVEYWICCCSALGARILSDEKSEVSPRRDLKVEDFLWFYGLDVSKQQSEKKQKKLRPVRLQSHDRERAAVCSLSIYRTSSRKKIDSQSCKILISIGAACGLLDCNNKNNANPHKQQQQRSPFVAFILLVGYFFVGFCALCPVPPLCLVSGEWVWLERHDVV